MTGEAVRAIFAHNSPLNVKIDASLTLSTSTSIAIYSNGTSSPELPKEDKRVLQENNSCEAGPLDNVVSQEKSTFVNNITA